MLIIILFVKIVFCILNLLYSFKILCQDVYFLQKKSRGLFPLLVFVLVFRLDIFELLIVVSYNFFEKHSRFLALGVLFATVSRKPLNVHKVLNTRKCVTHRLIHCLNFCCRTGTPSPFGISNLQLNNHFKHDRCIVVLLRNL